MPKTKMANKRLIKALANQVVQRNLETKFKDNEYNGTSVGTVLGGTVDDDLILVAQGTGASARDGDVINLTGFTVEGHITAGDNSNVVRVIIYIPKDPTDKISTETTPYDIYHDVDLNKFAVLHDKRYPCGIYMPKVFSIKRKFNKGARRGIRVNWYGGASNQFSKNRILMYLVSDSVASAHPKFSGYAKMWYKDA